MKFHIKKLFMIAAVAMGINSVSLAQVKIGTNPTTIDLNNNLEVQGSTAGRKFSVHKDNGQVTIADGTQGAGRVFTSNAVGTGRWEPAGLVVLMAYNSLTLQPTL